MSAKTTTMFGLTLDVVTMEDVIQACRSSLAERRRLLIGVVNAAKIVSLGGNAELRDSLLDCDIVVADGQSVVWASHLLGSPLPERVAGIDLFERLLQLAEVEDRGVYLLGARPDVLATLESKLTERFPRLRIVGSRDGYFTEAESAQVAADIRQSGADMLFLGMTSPKKEIFLRTYWPSLDVPILHGVGGSFDVFAGLTKRAPERWQRAGMEWAFRLVQEPRRLWRRYLVTNYKFLALTIRELMRAAPPYPKPERRPHVVIDLRDGMTPSIAFSSGAPTPAVAPALVNPSASVSNSGE